MKREREREKGVKRERKRERVVAITRNLLEDSNFSSGINEIIKAYGYIRTRCTILTLISKGLISIIIH